MPVYYLVPFQRVSITFGWEYPNFKRFVAFTYTLGLQCCTMLAIIVNFDGQIIVAD
jgi:hypothetical protein